MADESVAVEYRELPEFPGYRIGNDGSVWSCRQPIQGQKWRRLRLQLRSGYPSAFIYNTEGVQVPRLVHRLVLEAFVGPCPDGMECCHNNGVRSDNRLENLRWDTRKANGQDRIKHGTQLHGEQMPWHKITAEQAVEIRELYANGATTAELSKQFGIANTNIAEVIRGTVWRRAGGPTGSLRSRQTLSDDDVREIRRRYPAETAKQLGDAFGVPGNTVQYIVNGKRRKNVKQFA